MESDDSDNKSRHPRKVTSIGMDGRSEQVMKYYDSLYDLSALTRCIELTETAGLWPTWWPRRPVLPAPAPPASQTGRETVPPRSERRHGSGPGRGAGLGSPTHTASWGGRSRGGLENWNYPLSQSTPHHSLRDTERYREVNIFTGWDKHKHIWIQQ